MQFALIIIFDLSTEFKIHKRYRNVEFNHTIDIIENENYRYVFILFVL